MNLLQQYQANSSVAVSPEQALFDSRYNNVEPFRAAFVAAVVLGYSAAFLNVAFIVAVVRNKSLQNISNYMLIGQAIFDTAFTGNIAIFQSFNLRVQRFQGGLYICKVYSYILIFTIVSTVLHLCLIAHVRRTTVMLKMNQRQPFTLARYCLCYAVIIGLSGFIASLPLQTSIVQLGSYVLQPSGLQCSVFVCAHLLFAGLYCNADFTNAKLSIVTLSCLAFFVIFIATSYFLIWRHIVSVRACMRVFFFLF